MVRKPNECEQAALLLLENARAIHPLLRVWVHRIKSDDQHTADIPESYDDVAAEEWQAIGIDLSVLERDRPQFGISGERLQYPLERKAEYWAAKDGATRFLANAIVMHRLFLDHDLPREILRFHDLVVGIERDMARLQMEGS